MGEEMEEGERGGGRRERSVDPGVILNTLVAFSVLLLYYIPYMFMFVLPLVRVMREG